MTLKSFFLLMAVVFATSGGQLLLRRGAVKWVTGKGVLPFIVSFFRSNAPAALILVMGAPLIYWMALKTVSLSRAYGIMSLTGILVQIGGRLLLKEKPSPRTIAGALLCCAGIAVWGL
jgi:drug/metabolite transporter (DMT)-like permease